VSINHGVNEADILVFLVKHRQFIGLDMQGKQVLDFVPQQLRHKP